MIIGIVGFIGSGKGTVGDILADDYGFQKVAFANPLKDATASIFGWKREWLEGDTKESREWREEIDDFWSGALKRPGFTPRLALQLMGTEAGRDIFGEDIWVNALKARIDNYEGMAKDFVITDVRFPNEIEAIKSWGGYVYRIKRGEEPEWYRTAEIENTKPKSVNVSKGKTMANLYPNIHYSEWAWIGSVFDNEIANDGTIDDLKENIDHLIMQYAKKDL
jgi:hypothetical protein